MLTTTAVFAQRTPMQQIEWSVAAKLQNKDGSTSIGFAGAINAVSADQLIIAGGANFPDKMPWEGGRKQYSKEIHILEKSGPGFAWKKMAEQLPEAIAYCGNTSTKAGLVYAGGENEKGLSDKAFLLNWNSSDHKIEIKPLPNLPLALTNLALTAIGNVVYAVGGDGSDHSSNAIFSLDLETPAAEWKAHPDLPVALANAVVVADGKAVIYVIGGRTKNPSGISGLNSTVFAYHTLKQSWTRLAGISEETKTLNFSAGAGIMADQDHILLLGGDNGKVFHQIETYLSKISKSNDAAERARLTTEKNKLSTQHQGFYRGILQYRISTNTWTKIGELPFPAQVTASATKWDGGIVLSSGEIKPGIRTPNIMLGKIKNKK